MAKSLAFQDRNLSSSSSYPVAAGHQAQGFRVLRERSRTQKATATEAGGKILDDVTLSRDSVNKSNFISFENNTDGVAIESRL